MPRVVHTAERRASAPETIKLARRESNLFKLLRFIKDKEGATSQTLGHFLGTSHKEQAIIRGSHRLVGLVNDGLVSRGAQVDSDGRNSHAMYHITPKGLATLEAGHVVADPLADRPAKAV